MMNRHLDDEINRWRKIHPPYLPYVPSAPCSVINAPRRPFDFLYNLLKNIERAGRALRTGTSVNTKATCFLGRLGRVASLAPSESEGVTIYIRVASDARNVEATR
jgi:hypothetical protein